MKTLFRFPKFGNLYKFQTVFESITYNIFCYIIILFTAGLWELILGIESWYVSIFIGMIFGYIYINVSDLLNP